ncbi:hypothetical protein M4I32_15055 [Microbacterium sp. LRZ72]|uniref:hypothetical protein n=1 Tax=Microbacterium sp. LRZ72 TaxID=2942481 RepID=UPI0029BAF774|nr:hypothetical protein [Microbacterium sp. LRZ72]MDX2378108.1 hypothetical protein [Microbacterium sp. LRZ72]
MDADELAERMRTVLLFPEWCAGDIVSPSVPLSPEIRQRLRTWNRTWERVLDPLHEVRWPGVETGRRWIADGELLVHDMQAELGPSIRVVGDFAAYDPDGKTA